MLVCEALWDHASVVSSDIKDVVMRYVTGGVGVLWWATPRQLRSRQTMAANIIVFSGAKKATS